MKKYFPLIRVNDKIYEKFINTGVVSIEILRLLAFKTIKGIKLNEKEFSIFSNKTKEINDIILNIKNVRNTRI